MGETMATTRAHVQRERPVTVTAHLVAGKTVVIHVTPFFLLTQAVCEKKCRPVNTDLTYCATENKVSLKSSGLL